MKVRVTTARFVPTTALVNVGDEFTVCPEPVPNLFPMPGSAVVHAPKPGGGVVKTWLLPGSWETVSP